MHRLRQWRVLQGVLVMTDACAIALAFWFVFLIVPAGTGGPVHAGAWRLAHIALYVVGWVVLLAVYRLYDPEYLLDGFQQYTRITQASTAGLVLMSLVALFDGSVLISRAWFLAAWVLSILSLGVARFAMRRVVRALRHRGRFRWRLLIVGAGEDGLAIAQQLTHSAPNAAEIVGFLDEYSAIGAPVGREGQVLGEPLALARVAAEVGATDAIIVPQAISWEALQVLMQRKPDEWGVQHMWLAPALRDLLTTGMEVHQRGSLPLLSVCGPRITGLESMLKRGLDLALVLVLLPVLLPLGLAIALCIMCLRGEAPLVRHRMIGRDRRQFSLITFPALAGLRRWHLWRLPALINVLVGDVSLVGPRPIFASYGTEYHAWQLMLTSVRPGLTGPWWLLSGTASRHIETEVSLDLTYIQSYTIWLDFRLLMQTSWRMLTRHGIVTVQATTEAVLLGTATPRAEATPAATPTGGAQ